MQKAKMPEVVQALISSLASPDSDLMANDLVVVGHGLAGDLEKLHDMRISGYFSFCFSR